MLSKGFITISRPSFGSDKEIISIKIGDSASHKQFVEVEIGLREFALVLTGQGHVTCQFELNNVELVGKIREHKTEMVPLPESYYGMSGEALACLLAPFETNGWKGCLSDLKNGKCHSTNPDGQRVANVGFIRYVDALAVSESCSAM